VTEPGKFALDASVSPAGVLGSELQHQLPQYPGGGWAARRLRGRIGPLARRPLPVPAQQCRGLHKEDRPPHPGKHSRQHGQHGPVGWVRSRTVDLTA
jgi:hypothetical protein